MLSTKDLGHISKEAMTVTVCCILSLFVGVLIGRLCSCYGVQVFAELQDCIYGGIRDNIDRDLSTAGPELVEKLARQSSWEEEETQRVK